MPQQRPEAGECHVWYADVAQLTHEQQTSLSALLVPAERTRWRSFRHPGAAALYLVGHALVRVVVADAVGVPGAELTIHTVCALCGDNHGKPQVVDGGGIEYSLSHSGTLALVAVADTVPVGVDVETATSDVDLDVIAPTLLGAGEREVIAALAPERRRLAMLRYWVRKEAVLKATGHGLVVAPNQLRVSEPDQPAALIEWARRADSAPAIHLADVDVPVGHLASLASIGQALAVSSRNGSELLGLA